MRRADRGRHTSPAALVALDRQGRSELDRARNHQRDTNPARGSFDYSKYRDKDVKQRLEAIFHGKCAYCETLYDASGPMDVEHFRPKGGVAGEVHPGYWWLAAAWENLLPSCIDCNRKREQRIVEMRESLTDLQLESRRTGAATASGKHDSFPLDHGGIRASTEACDLTSERPLLLNPCVDDPAEHLVFSIDAGKPALVSAQFDASGAPSARGLASIHLFGLNRLGLVQNRTRTLRQMQFMGEAILDLSGLADDLRDIVIADAIEARRMRRVVDQLEALKDRMLAELKGMTRPEAQYSTMATAWLAAFKDRIRVPGPVV